MGPSTKTSLARKFPLRLRRLVPGHHTIQGSLDGAEERERLVGGGSSFETTAYCQSPPTQLQIMGSPTPKVDAAALLQRYVQMAQDLQPSLPSTCRRVNRGDLKLISKQPIAAGSFADISEATYNGLKVMLKSYRCYVSFDVAQIVARFKNEVLVWTFLHDRGLDVVPLVGVYSTEARPFGLVYETMDGLDLRQHLRNNPNAGKLNLLLGIARHLSRMHEEGVAHGDLRMSNILVDKDGAPHVAGLGNGHIPSHPVGRTGSTAAKRISRSCQPESNWPGVSPRITGATHPTTAGDAYAFGVMVFEVLTGQPPFPELPELTATCSMLSGSRPPRPDHNKVSDRAWRMIQSCWNPSVSRRMQMKDAVVSLEKELGLVPV